MAEKKYFLPRKSISSHSRCSVKEGLQGLAQVFSCEHCGNYKKIYLWTAVYKIQDLSVKFTKGREFLNFITLLNLFVSAKVSITFFARVFLLLFFFSQTRYFYHKKVVSEHTSSDVSSFLHRWGYCCKCEFDKDIKIE